jgi:hypothetical protein
VYRQVSQVVDGKVAKAPPSFDQITLSLQQASEQLPERGPEATQ